MAGRAASGVSQVASVVRATGVARPCCKPPNPRRQRCARSLGGVLGWPRIACPVLLRIGLPGGRLDVRACSLLPTDLSYAQLQSAEAAAVAMARLLRASCRNRGRICKGPELMPF